ncbi:unnamed protein product [Cladocopium goreaui]|uniref:PA domain-containing protein n=1 Tax=Cladocopium goreaui TaxID=2562237 RepID=A0A9P1C7K1_9DINO|nr:unnamed protein product [Cladocopium goreaui]
MTKECRKFNAKCQAQTSNLVPTERGQRSDVVRHVLVDLVLFTATVLVIYGISSLPSSQVLWIVLSVLLVLMVLWRVLHLQSAKIAEIPYTCGYASANGKDVYIVSTLHISPRSERDVIAAIAAVHPDVVMIELDEERLEFMRGPSQRPVLQQFQYTVENGTDSSDAVPLVTQRAYWNGEFAGDQISGPIVLHSSGSSRFSPSVSGCIVLVEDPGLAPLAQLAFAAAKEEARALLCAAHTARAGLSGQQLPAGRLGNESLLTDLRVATRARNMGYPPIPVLMMSQNSSQQLMAKLQTATVQGSFQVLPDDFPRRTLRRRICQEMAFALSGIWLLYGVMECFQVDAGDEFLAAEREAQRRQLPCLCIDLDMDRLCSRFAAAAIPYPQNLLASLRAWLSVPRHALRICFPWKCALTTKVLWDPGPD